MRILVATQGNGGLDDLVSIVFGRAPTFTLIDVENGKIKKTEVRQNTSASSFRGVGIASAQLAAEENVNVVIAGDVGPNAYSVLTQAGIEVVTGMGGMKVKEAVEKYLKKGNKKDSPSFPINYMVTTKTDVEFEKKMLELQKKMIESRIEYLDKKIQELEKNE